MIPASGKNALLTSVNARSLFALSEFLDLQNNSTRIRKHLLDSESDNLPYERPEHFDFTLIKEHPLGLAMRPAIDFDGNYHP